MAVPDSARPLRVGLLLDTLTLPAWQLLLLDRVVRTEYSDVVVAALATPMPRRQRRLGERLAELGPRGRALVWRYLEWDTRRPRGGPDPFAPQDASTLLQGVPTLTVTPVRTRFTDRFTDEDLARLRPYDLDVMIRLGFRILVGPILTLPRYGVWSLHHGDNRVNRGGPAGFWEVVNGVPETGAILQILTEDLDGGPVLSRTFSSTQGSVGANRWNYYWKTALLIPRKLRELHRVGAEAFLARVREQNSTPHFYTQRLFRTPGNGEFLRLMGRTVAGRIGRRLRRLVQGPRWRQWILLYAFGPAPSRSLRRFRQLVPPPDQFWADPFVYRRDGKYYVFFERLFYRSPRGVIAVIGIEPDGTVSEPRTVLERPYHVSYPFLFEWAGELYMIPETGAAGTIEAYRCTRFPDEWEPCGRLMTGVNAYDTTLVQRDGRWWLFTTMSEAPGIAPHEELFVFSAPEPLTTDWTPHPANPVISDVSCGRAAGGFFEIDGRLYRPSQDSRGRYGRAVSINEVVTLTPTDYAERKVAAIEPEWDPAIIGVHHLSFAGDLTVVDGQLLRRGRQGG